MRQATSREAAYRWHTQTLQAKKDGTKPPPIHENTPQCGWFVRRLVAKGPYVPCRIWLESPTDPETGELTGPELFRCEIDGQRRPVDREWTFLAGRPISEDEYMDMLASRMAARSRAEAPAPVETTARQESLDTELARDIEVFNAQQEPNAADDASAEWEPPWK